MNYLVAVLSNRFQVEAAYTALEKENLPKEQNKYSWTRLSKCR